MNKYGLTAGIMVLSLAWGHGVFANDEVLLRETDPAVTNKARQAESKRGNPLRETAFYEGLSQNALDDASKKEKDIPEGKTINIDLQSTVKRAVENNRDIRLSEWKREQAEAEVSEAAAAKNPQLAYTMQGARTKSSVPDTITGQRITNGFSNGLNVTWALWTGGAAEGAIDAARYAENVAFTDIYQKEAEAKLSAVTAYYQYLESINLAEVSQEAVSNLTGHMTNVEQQYQAGIVAKLDVLSSNVSLANAKQNQIAAENQRNVAEANLNTVMRLPMNTKLNPADKTFPEPTMDITLEQALHMAATYRWELIKADYGVKIASEQVRIAEAGYLPTVAVGAGYSWKDTEFPGFEHEGWNVGGTVSWSVWDGGATGAKVKKAKSQLKEAQETLLQARENVELEVRSDYLNVLSAKEKIAATKAAVEQAEEAYKIAVVRYRSGVGINLDVLDAELALNQAKTNYITAMYDYNIGIATLEKAMGIPAVLHPEFQK